METVSFSDARIAFVRAYVRIQEGKQVKLYKENNIWYVEEIKGE